MKYARPEDIPDAVVERIKTLKTYKFMARRRASDRGIAYEDVTDDMWRQIYWDKSKRRSEYYRKVQLAEKVGVDLPAAAAASDNGGDADDISEYTEYYSDPAPNDLLTIKSLVSMQKQLALIDTEIQNAISGEEINVARWRDLARIQKELSTETRMLQETLGISRKAREARAHEEELSDRLTANIEQARQLLDERGIKLICPHCKGTGGSVVMQGFVIHHFTEMGLSVTTRCPACQKQYTINRSPEKWIRQVEPPI
ncbi:MAG: hypothetical protein GWN93_06135 [Deltaproteobacteria bacterium]|nr:hypothetical protein [Deltaproteobacteria bacterium]